MGKIYDREYHKFEDVPTGQAIKEWPAFLQLSGFTEQEAREKVNELINSWKPYKSERTLRRWTPDAYKNKNAQKIGRLGNASSKRRKR